MRSSFYSVLVVACLLGQVVGFADPLRIHLEDVNEVIDGMPSRYLKLSGTDFDGVRYPGGNWILGENPPGDASIRFLHRYQPEIAMDFAVFDQPELIEDYKELALREYVLSLRSGYANKGLKLEEAKAVKAPVGSVPFIGGTYWEINYNLVEAQTENLLRSVTEFVSVDDDQRNYRLRFSGPADLMEKFGKSFVDELGRFTLE